MHRTVAGLETLDVALLDDLGERFCELLQGLYVVRDLRVVESEGVNGVFDYLAYGIEYDL